MQCKCKYYEYKNGELVCSNCGKPAPQKNVIEDKIGGRPEVKLNETPVQSGIDKPVQGKKRR